MNIAILSYGVVGHDGRLKELIKSCELIGKTYVIAIAVDEENRSNETIKLESRDKRFSFLNYFKFIIHSINIMKKIKPLDILVVDDFTSSVVGFIINFIFNPKFLIQDSRELYIDKKMPGLGNVFLKFEQMLFERSDLIVCANQQRSVIMKEKLKLKEYPYVFENIRILDGHYNENVLNEKYMSFNNSRIKIISTGGCSIARGTKNLVLAMKKLPDYDLYIIGKGRNEDYNEIMSTINSEQLLNVHILERIPLNELLYLVRSCDIGIVEYHKNDMNNLYCASGKVYEYMNEGLPVVTTENIPLIELCNSYRIGVADDTFIRGINEVAKNLDFYKKNVDKFMLEISVEKNNDNLARKIRNVYENKMQVGK